VPNAGFLSRAAASARTWPTRRLFLVALCAFVVCWGFYWALYFPGCCSTDSDDILKMVLGLDTYSNHFRYDGLSSHHPLLYTAAVAAVMGPIVALGGSVTVAVGAFSFLQMVVLAACVGAATCWAARRGVPKAAVVAVIVFFALNPLVARFAVTLWKDVPFAGVLLLFCLVCCDVARTRGAWLSSRRRWALFIVLASLVALLRSNGALVALAAVVALAIACKPARGAILLRAAGAVAVVLIVQGVGARLAGVAPAHFAETVSLPLQQLARTSVEGGQLSDDQQQVLYSILPQDRIAELFSETTPNPLKFAPDFNDEYLESHKVEFISAWLGALPANIGSYARAWADETRGYWDVRQESWLVSSPGYDIVDADENVTASLLGGLAESSAFGGDHPTDVMSRMLYPLCNAACLGWFAIACLVIGLIFRKPGLAGMALPAVLLWVTMLLAAPISNEFRYVFALHVLVPFLLCAFCRSASADDSCEGNSPASGTLRLSKEEG
jgi:hypothetical protein